MRPSTGVLSALRDTEEEVFDEDARGAGDWDDGVGTLEAEMDD